MLIGLTHLANTKKAVAGVRPTKRHTSSPRAAARRGSGTVRVEGTLGVLSELQPTADLLAALPMPPLRPPMRLVHGNSLFTKTRMSLTDLYEEGLSVDELVREVAGRMARDRPRGRWWHRVTRLDYARDGEQFVSGMGGLEVGHQGSESWVARTPPKSVCVRCLSAFRLCPGAPFYPFNPTTASNLAEAVSGPPFFPWIFPVAAIPTANPSSGSIEFRRINGLAVDRRLWTEQPESS